MSKLNPKVLLVHVGPEKMDYPFRSFPLGLMYLSSYARREVPGSAFKIIDMKVTPCTTADIGRLAFSEKADIVGLSALTVHSREMESVAHAVKKASPSSLVLAGGPHATCFPDKLLGSGAVDAVVAGEGERAFVNILERWKKSEPFEGIEAVATTKTSGQPARSIIDNPDHIPFPAWDLVDMLPYWDSAGFSILGKRKYMNVFTSRACPYSCIYCHNIFGRNFRPRSAESVLEEIRKITRDYSIYEFDILDDVFNLNKNRVVKICEELIKNEKPIKISFPNGLRSDLLDDEIIHLLKRAGVSYISFAIETASPRLQKLISKNLDLKKAAAAIKTASKAGILCNGFFMLGFPTETEQELLQTVKFAIKTPLHVAHFLRVTPFEGTALHDMLSDEKKEFLAEHPEFMCYEDRNINMSDVPLSRFRLIFRYALLRFYLNPLRFIAVLKRHPNRKNLLSMIPVTIKRLIIKG